MSLNAGQVEKLPMDLYSQPDTVWMCFREEERLVEKSQHIFHRTLSDEEYVKLVGARTGETILIYPCDYPRSTGSPIPVIFVRHHRTVLINGHLASILVVSSIAKPEMEPQIAFQNCVVPEIAQRKGLATWMLGEQVVAARVFGFEKIVDYADSREGRNGFYTWPRLGFDKEFAEKDVSRLPNIFKHFTRLSDLIEDEEAREWWKKNGFALHLIFDTSPDSRSMQLLNAALERMRQKGRFWDSGPVTPLNIERGPSLRTRRDWRPRTWEYRQV